MRLARMNSLGWISGELNILESDDIVAGFDGGHTLADGLDDTGTLVSKDDGESTLRVLARQSVGI